MPCKTVRRIMVGAWGKDTEQYVGRSMTLYRDPTVSFGGMVVGGIRVSHMSHIDSEKTLALQVTRGMAENSKIEWTDHTFNPWIGCTKVSPACDNCYAEAMMDKRYGRVEVGRWRSRASARRRATGAALQVEQGGGRSTAAPVRISAPALPTCSTMRFRRSGGATCSG
jgi:hypothetical protein